MPPAEVDWDEDEVASTSLPSLRPCLLSCAVAAGWIAFGSIHRDQHSDSLLNVLVSLQCWTPFVWEQDRFGMLIPLLATPIRSPLANLLFQATLASFAGLAAYFLLARYAIRHRSYAMVATVGAAALLALTPPYYRFEYLIDTSYGLGLSLALWGLILVEPGPREGSTRKLAGALGLMVLAHWVNSATALFLGPFVAFRSLLALGRPARWPLAILIHQSIPRRQRVEILARGLWRIEASRGLVVLATGYAMGGWLTFLSPTQPTNLAALPWEEWPLAWTQLLRGFWMAVEPPFWPALLTLEAVIGIIGLVSLNLGRRSRVGREVVALLVTAVLLWLLMGTRKWVKINDYSFRYLFPSALFVQTAVAGLAMVPSGRFLSTRTPEVLVQASVTALLLAAATWSYGLPSLAAVRRDIDRRCGTLTDDLLAARCTCLAGDYWTVWPAVFHANLVLHERGDPRPFWGLSYRSLPTFALWKRTPRDRCLVAVPVGDGLGEFYLRAYLPGKFKPVDDRRTIRVLRLLDP